MRSSCLRIRQERVKGPKSLKLNEYTNQLHHYGANWKYCVSELPRYVEMTAALLIKSDVSLSSKILQPLPTSEQSKYLLNIEFDDDISIDITELIEKTLTKYKLISEIIYKIIIIQISKPQSVDIFSDKEFSYMGDSYFISYRSHAKFDLFNKLRVYFRYNKWMYLQENDEMIIRHKYGLHKNVFLISVVISKKTPSLMMENFKDFVYGDKDQKKLRRTRLKCLNPEMFELLQESNREKDRLRNLSEDRKAMMKKIDKERDKTNSRKAMHKVIDKTRDETSSRKLMHKAIDKIREETSPRKLRHRVKDKKRDQTSPRKLMHKTINKIRDQTNPRKMMHKAIDKTRDETSSRKAMHKAIDSRRNKQESRKLSLRSYERTDKRLHYKKKINNTKYQKQLLKSLPTETGFDVICISCMQYKSKSLCRIVQDKMKSNYKTVFVKDCYLLKNRTKNQFVCNMCFNQIKQGKVPKRSKINKYKFSSFPNSLVSELKRHCIFKEQQSSSVLQEEDKIYERKQLELNRLESYLLKPVIPFIRIAHCPKGPYLKLKGDLILISSNLDHSISRILPLEQKLIPVCFKRKLAYSGAYIQEVVEKNKVLLYLDWLKQNNHLFRDIELDTQLLDKFLSESLDAMNQFENITRGGDKESAAQVDTSNEEEDIQEIFCKDDHENDKTDNFCDVE